MAAFNSADLKRRMEATLASLKDELNGLRTGRASASMVEPITVEAYGGRLPLAQVGTISVPEPRLITVQVWDATLAKPTEKAIRDAGLGLNPQAEGAVIRIPVPQLNEERRKELTKVAGKYAEAARIATRNIRRDGMDSLKKAEKDKEISEDESKKKSEEVQKLTDDHIKKIDLMVVEKEKEIMTI